MRALFTVMMFFCCLCVFATQSEAYNNRKASKLFKKAKEMIDVDSDIALSMFKKALKLSRPRSKIHKKIKKLLKLYTRILRAQKGNGSSPAGVRYLPPKKRPKPLPPIIEVKGSLPAGHCTEIQKVLDLLAKHKLNTDSVQKLKKRYCDQKHLGTPLVFALKIITLDKDQASISKCKIYVGRKMLGKTDGFGTFNGRIRGKLGHQITFLIRGRGRRNFTIVKKVLKAWPSKNGLKPELVQFQAVLRRR